jgi:hypothetical protein
VIITLVVSSLETHAVRPNFVKTLAYVTGDAEMQYKLGAFYYHGLEVRAGFVVAAACVTA